VIACTTINDIVPSAARDNIVAAKALDVVAAVSTTDSVCNVFPDVKDTGVLAPRCDVLHRPAEGIEDDDRIWAHLVEEHRGLQPSEGIEPRRSIVRIVVWRMN